MNTTIRLNKIVCLALLLLAVVSNYQSIYANELWSGFESQSSFSEFAPPSLYSDYGYKKEDKIWQSGNSFKQTDRLRNAPIITRGNPWKPVASTRFKQSFTSQRPWGSIPELKRNGLTNMRFHDERFKQWSRQIDYLYNNRILYSEYSPDYGYSSLPYMTNYGFPGSFYNTPLVTPGIYPGMLLSPFGSLPGPLFLSPYRGLPGTLVGW